MCFGKKNGLFRYDLLLKIVFKFVAALAGVHRHALKMVTVVFYEGECVLEKRAVSVCTTYITILANAVSAAERVPWRTV